MSGLTFNRLFPQKTLPHIPALPLLSRRQLLALIKSNPDHLTVKQSTFSRYVKSFRLKGKRGVYYHLDHVQNLFDRDVFDLRVGESE